MQHHDSETIGSSDARVEMKKRKENVNMYRGLTKNRHCFDRAKVLQKKNKSGIPQVTY